MKLKIERKVYKVFNYQTKITVGEGYDKKIK